MHCAVTWQVHQHLHGHSEQLLSSSSLVILFITIATSAGQLMLASGYKLTLVSFLFVHLIFFLSLSHHAS